MNSSGWRLRDIDYEIGWKRWIGVFERIKKEKNETRLYILPLFYHERHEELFTDVADELKDKFEKVVLGINKYDDTWI